MIESSVLLYGFVILLVDWRFLTALRYDRKQMKCVYVFCWSGQFYGMIYRKQYL